MDIERRIELVARSPTEEIITVEDLREIFETYSYPTHYIGFEISGKVHIGSGLMTAIKIKDFLEAQVKPIIFLADYHAWINGKLEGNLEKIQEVALGYFKHAFISLGLTEDKVKYILASDIYDKEYWKLVLSIGKNTSINRILRTITIMGRKEGEATNASAIFYPAMQAADIIKLGVQIAHAGMDQRKVHMLAREVFPKLYNYKFVAVHCHLIPGLKGSQKMMDHINREDIEINIKMSKSDPSSAIFIHDTPEEIMKKINSAFCQPKLIENNPVLEYAIYICMHESSLKIERDMKFGGDIEFQTPQELKEAFSKGEIHPADLKNAVANKLIEMLKPCRDYFNRNKHYLEQIENVKITK